MQYHLQQTQGINLRKFPAATQRGIIPQGRLDIQSATPYGCTLLNTIESGLLLGLYVVIITFLYALIPRIMNVSAFIESCLLTESSSNENQFHCHSNVSLTYS